MRLRPIPLALLAALTLTACGEGGGGPDPIDGETGWQVAGTRDLVHCWNPGSLVADGAGIWVSCAGDYGEHAGQVVRIDVDGDKEVTYATGGTPGPLALTDTAVVVGDLMEGQLFLVDRAAGQVVHGAEDPVLLCPPYIVNEGTEEEDIVHQFISGLTVVDGTVVASCFSTDQVVALDASDWTETGRVDLDGDPEVTRGPGTLAALPGGRLALVAGASDEVFTLSTAAGLALEGPLALTSDTPQGLAVAGDRLLVVNSESQTLQALDPADGSTRWETYLGDATNPYEVAVVGDRALVSLLEGDGVAVVDLADGHLLGTLALPDGAAPQGLAALEDGRVAVALTYYDLATYTVPRTGGVALLEPAE